MLHGDSSHDFKNGQNTPFTCCASHDCVHNPPPLTASGYGRNTGSEATSSGESAEWQESPEGQKWAEALQDLDIAVAERRCADAVQLLRKADTDCAQPLVIDWSDPDHQARYALHLCMACI